MSNTVQKGGISSTSGPFISFFFMIITLKMSILPLPKVRCSLPKTRKYPIDVTGTANISYGHKLRERENCQVAKYHVKPIFEEEDKRQYEQFLKTLEFEKETDRKIKNKNLRRRVQQGIETDVNNFFFIIYMNIKDGRK